MSEDRGEMGIRFIEEHALKPKERKERQEMLM